MPSRTANNICEAGRAYQYLVAAVPRCASASLRLCVNRLWQSHTDSVEPVRPRIGIGQGVLCTGAGKIGLAGDGCPHQVREVGAGVERVGPVPRFSKRWLDTSVGHRAGL